MIEVVF